jgi:LacI family sucrose operon transcriptional repressor
MHNYCKEGASVPTQADVAARAGVTVTTVSRMLNNRGSISAKTRVKILAVMKELDYQPNEIAQSLSKKAQKIIGLIVPSASNYFFCKIVDGVERYAAQYGYKIFLCASNHEKTKELEYFGMLRANKVAGIILASRTQDLLNGMSFDSPIVTIDRQISPKIPSVCSDNYGGGVLAAEHLLEKGCRCPAYFSGSPKLNMDGNKRLAGFVDIMIKHKIQPVILELSEEQFYKMDYEQVITTFMGKRPDIDGVFASNDVIASQIIRYCSKAGIRVPEDLKVVGYDDISLAALYTPSITTIRQPVDQICRSVIEAIVYRNEKAIPLNTVFPVTLIPREST